MALVMVVSGGVGWFAYRARVERQAAESVLGAGGSITYDWQWHDGKVSKKAQPSWLIRHLGSGYFEHIVAIQGGPRLDDAALARIGRLPKLKRLYLSPCRVTGEGLAHLRGLTNLTHLKIVTERAKGESLANLSRMEHLRMLRVWGISITNADLVHLSGLTDLEDLGLHSPDITDAALVTLGGFPRLAHLWLTDSHVTPAGITSLQSKLPKLTITP